MNGKHQITDPESSQNSKQDVSQKVNTRTCNIETAKKISKQTKRQRKNFGRIQRKIILYLQRKKI